MTNPAFEKFVTRVRQSRRIGFADLRRLQRDVLPEGIGSRKEAEALIALDQHLEKADGGWVPFLASAVRAFVVRQADREDPDGTAWLVSALSGASAKTALIIAREVIRGRDEVDGDLLAFAKQRPRTGAKPQPASTPVLAEDHCPT